MATTRKWLPTLVLAAVMCCSSVGFAESATDTCNAFMYPGSDDVNIKIAAIYGVHVSNGTACSDRPAASTVQIALAMHWAATLLNGDNSTESFIPGVKIGIIGTTMSQTATLVTTIARSSNIPVVGIAATLAELSNKTMYPGFTRATPNDHLQAEVRMEKENRSLMVQ
ncbi:glutamate receptor, metabotropic [Elysia marginata]|uniref:Glutamate receptor, metabotropic n=1 Tax=Elysia marginata TaxID=1093978 RepID=A0AAV4HH91_9GAST|nr:glutamate receptor, metabotropic [Elysia marginata]